MGNWVIHFQNPREKIKSLVYKKNEMMVIEMKTDHCEAAALYARLGGV